MYAKLAREKDEFKSEWIKLRIEKQEKYLATLMLRPLNYEQTVVKIYKDYEELVFNLSEASKNETIESIKKFSLGQRLEFEGLLIKRINRQNKHGRTDKD